MVKIIESDYSQEIARKYFVTLNKEKERGYTRYFILNDGYYEDDIIADSDEEAIDKFNHWLSNRSSKSKFPRDFERFYDDKEYL